MSFCTAFRGIAAAVVVVALAAPAGSPLYANRAGQWREKARISWDMSTNASVRRPVRVFDPHPELDLDFQWEPHPGAGADARGTVYGPGRLTWRERGTAAWDGGAIVSDYVGQMSDGRPHGAGRIVLQSGLSYEGEWRDGRMEGRGHLRLPSGDDYQGDFVADRPHGMGRYAAADGTSFHGPFLNGQRDGVGVLTLADGTSYRSHWQKGREIARTPQAPQRARPPGTIAPAPGAVGVVLNLFVDRKMNTEFKGADPDNSSFVYEGVRDGSLLTLRLDSKELMGLWKGEATIDAYSNDLFEAVEQFAPVFLVVDVTNEREQAIEIGSAYADVERSDTDLQPFLTIRSRDEPGCFSPSQDGSGHFNPTFGLVNAGWGPVQRASLSYAFGDESGPRTQRFTFRAGDFDESTQVTTEGGLQASGLDIRNVRHGHFKCPSSDQLPSCLAQLKTTGILGKLSGAVFLQGSCLLTRVTGTINYQWTDAQGSPHQRQSPISVDRPVLKFDVPEGAEEAAPGPVERNIRPVKLGLDVKDYRLPVGIRGRLGPRENRRFALSLAADKSSAHHFSVALELADGSTVSSPRVDLLYFRPRLRASTREREDDQEP